MTESEHKPVFLPGSRIKACESYWIGGIPYVSFKNNARHIGEHEERFMDLRLSEFIDIVLSNHDPF